MASFKEARDLSLLSLCANVIDEETFAFLYDINSSGNLDLPYDNYEKFDLDNLCDDESKSEFRFYKNDIFHLQEVLRIPDQLYCYNRVKVNGIEALCMFLKRFCYPCRYSDMIPRFARPVPQICMVTNIIMSYIYDNFLHLLSDFNQQWLSPASLSDLSVIFLLKVFSNK